MPCGEHTNHDLQITLLPANPFLLALPLDPALPVKKY